MTLDNNSSDPFVVVACYNEFDNLAHAPSGTCSKFGLYVYRLECATGELTLQTIVQDETLSNPAFLRVHPEKNIIYACTESINENGSVHAFSVSPTTGMLREIGRADAGGTSTCYITIDHNMERMLLVNYWDSSICSIDLDQNGFLNQSKVVWKPPTKLKAQKRTDHLQNRQSEPHTHALVLDPIDGRVAYVPDLGEDCIRQFVYSGETGKLSFAGQFPSGEITEGALGPRYIEFHPSMNVCYVVNEIASTVSVFELDETLLSTLTPSNKHATCRLIQTVSTIPFAFPKMLNTCGRIALDPTGNFLVVSNRGHNSIAVFPINKQEGGRLESPSFSHTRGKTPRHFQFDPTGKYLLAANQDTDSVTVFRFCSKRGKLEFTGHSYCVPSPNFVQISSPKIRRKE